MTLFQLRVAAIAASIARIDDLLSRTRTLCGTELGYDLYVNHNLELVDYGCGGLHIATVPRLDWDPFFSGVVNRNRWVCRMLTGGSIFAREVEARFGVNLKYEIYGK